MLRLHRSAVSQKKRIAFKIVAQNERGLRHLIVVIGRANQRKKLSGGNKHVMESSSAALIAPIQRGQFRRLQPQTAFDAFGVENVRVESHYDVPQSDFEVPGMTHHMLSIALNVRTRMQFGWQGVAYDGSVQSGDLILLPAGCPSRCRWEGRFSEAAIVYLAPAFLSRLAEQEWGRDPARLELVGSARFQSEPILWLGRMLRDAADEGWRPGSRLLLESLSMAMGMMLLRSCSTLSAPLQPARQGGLPPRALRRVLDYIHAQPTADIGLSALAAVSGYSPQHFKRAFKVSTGVPPHQYVLAWRIEHAKTMLQRSTLSLAEIAAGCGFSSQSHFTTAFRQRTRLTPGLWRQRGLI